MQVLYIVINLRTRPIHLTTFWVNIRGLFNPTHIDRVARNFLKKIFDYLGKMKIADQ